MRGRASEQHGMWVFYDPESLISPKHPLRAVKRRADAVLAGMSAEFDRAYAAMGRPGIPPLVDDLRICGAVRLPRQAPLGLQVDVRVREIVLSRASPASWPGGLGSH
ncbi:MAG TPA: hypothetical protein VJT67_14215 [Longimicrobiaceae bacterium]|nr:hypothetical protein [Longimicrobiaceae bacterium]